MIGKNIKIWRPEAPDDWRLIPIKGDATDESFVIATLVYWLADLVKGKSENG